MWLTDLSRLAGQSFYDEYFLLHKIANGADSTGSRPHRRFSWTVSKIYHYVKLSVAFVHLSHIGEA
jgi:hypothetical protein